ncbi:MAG TPA: hypothetical protein VLF89_05450 [Candidatus Saccharimonadales bacterium]|nr:hypothetical protein [Candidatus Saccharimonadales bacterium]
MDNTRLLEQISELIDTKLEPINKHLDTVEMKVELINKRVEKAQEETIETLSELIGTGYDMHENRIKKLEEHLNIPQAQ